MSVFVSSTYEDLVDHRRAAVDALERLGQIAGRMEVFGARPAPAVDASLEEVANSDLFVGIYAHRYGSVSPDTGASITEREFDEASQRGKPLFAFIVDDDYHWNPRFVEADPGRSRLAKLKERIRSQCVVDRFTSPEDLSSKVATSVGRYLLAQASERIPAPAASGQVSLTNVALLHTSFVSAKGTERFSDGRTYYQFEVMIVAPPAVMQRISSVTYHLENSWPPPNRVQIITDRASRFKMKELANGTSIVTADISIDGQAEPLRLNRFIDLRPDGPRL